MNLKEGLQVCKNGRKIRNKNWENTSSYWEYDKYEEEFINEVDNT